MAGLAQEGRYLIRLLASLVNGTPADNPPKDLDCDRLYRFSAYHRLSGMACYGIEKLEPGHRPGALIMERFERDRKIARAREAAQHITLDNVLKAFEQNGVYCIPLKGCLVKYLYPRPDMRMMADMDILFKDGQTEKVKEIMLGMGFTQMHSGGNHDVYWKKPFLNIEMHRRLVPEGSRFSEYMKKSWERAILEQGCDFIHRFSTEDLYIYLLIHLIKHYTRGGTGIRSILDIWLYNRHYDSQMGRDYIDSQLERIKLREFEGHIGRLGDIWFGNAQGSELYEKMAEYIFASGVYGTGKHGIIASMNEKKGGRKMPAGMVKLMYRLGLFFPGLKHMSILYPFLHRLPFLLPFTWVLRGLKCLLFRCRRTFRIIKNVRSVSQKDLDRVQDLHQQVGL
jgi:hypothetical protein